MPRATLVLLSGMTPFCFGWMASAETSQPVAPAEHHQVAQAPAPVAISSDTARTSTIGAPMAQVASAPVQTGQPGPAAQPPAPVAPPFQLNAVEQQFVDQILDMWERESDKIKTFDSRFERWEYSVFGAKPDIPLIKSVGQLTYSKPDKGSFKIHEIRRYKPQEDPNLPPDWVLQKHEIGEHWVCDGKAVYQYRHEKKQLLVQPLPPEMRGQQIVDGPLPFLFGAKADKLKSRYWIRSPSSNAESIQLQAYPRRQVDAANYHHVDVMLDRKMMMPTAIQVHMPNGQDRAVYMFQHPTVNGKLNRLFGALFNAPRTPLGWTRVIEEIPSGLGPGGPQNPQAATSQETSHR